MTVQPPVPLAQRRLAGRYRLDRPLARGGMATVWLATDLVLNRRVAVKLLAENLAADPTFVERFQREAQSAARLNHPGIVSIYDSATEDGLSAIVMQYVPGTTLRHELDQRTLGLHEAVGIGVQVAEALQAAHEAGIIHRDVKPANILLGRADRTEERVGALPRVCVTDFGIAKAVTDDGAADLTRTGSMLGTAKYLAPEQIRGGRVDPRTDVYALGVVLYEATCGRPPFVGEGDLATAMARLQHDPLPPRRIRSDISRDLEAVVLRALAREPADRYATAAELRAALVAVDPGPDATAEDPTVSADITASFVESERRWLVPSLVVVAVALALVAGGIVVGRTGAGRDLVDRAIDAVGGTRTTTTEAGPGDATPLTLTAATFDPLGPDRNENDDLVARVVDGAADDDPWRTQCYGDGLAGVPKAGVGITLTAPQPAELDELVVRGPAGGWDAAVYVADQAIDDAGGEGALQQWGKPVATVSDAGPTEIVDLGDRSGTSVLLWFTSMEGVPRDDCFGSVANSQRIEITEVTLTGS